MCCVLLVQVWLDANTQRAGHAEAVGPVEDCFRAVNSSCSDCMLPTCSHAYWHVSPKPISRQFSFCSGHAAMTAEEMSPVAWMRVISWRTDACAHGYGVKPGDGRSAFAASRPEEQHLRDAPWLQYYAAGTSGWREEWDAHHPDR